MGIQSFSTSKVGKFNVEIGPKKSVNGTDNVITGDCKVKWLRICNSTGAPISIQVQDRQGTPVNIIPSFNLPAGGMITLFSAEGDTALGGLAIISGAATLDVFGVVAML